MEEHIASLDKYFTVNEDTTSKENQSILKKEEYVAEFSEEKKRMGRPRKHRPEDELQKIEVSSNDQSNVFISTEYQDTCVIIGSSLSAAKELQVIDKYIPSYKKIGIKKSETRFDVDFIVSPEPETLVARKMRSKNKDVITCTGQPREAFFQCKVDSWIKNANSGCEDVGMAIKVAIALNFKNIILCGCPLDHSEGFVTSSNGNNSPVSMTKQLRFEWVSSNLEKESAQYPEEVRVSSMSGYTMDLFGPPDFMYEEMQSNQV